MLSGFKISTFKFKFPDIFIFFSFSRCGQDDPQEGKGEKGRRGGKKRCIGKLMRRGKESGIEK